MKNKKTPNNDLIVYSCTIKMQLPLLTHITVQITGNVTSTHECTSSGGRVTCISISCDMQPAPAHTKIIAYLYYWLAQDNSQALVSTVTLQLVPCYKWSPGPSTTIFAAIDGPPGPSISTIDGLPCRKWSPSFFYSILMECWLVID